MKIKFLCSLLLLLSGFAHAGGQRYFTGSFGDQGIRNVVSGKVVSNKELGMTGIRQFAGSSYIGMTASALSAIANGPCEPTLLPIATKAGYNRFALGSPGVQLLLPENLSVIPSDSDFSAFLLSPKQGGGYTEVEFKAQLKPYP